MEFVFSIDDIRLIGQTLGGEASSSDDSYVFQLSSEQSRQSLTLTIHNKVRLGDDTEGALVVAQTQHGYFELHDCNAFMPFEPDEIIFLAVRESTISCLVLGSQCTCSMFVDIRREILNSDFGKLDPRVLMSAMQLSLAESVVSEND